MMISGKLKIVRKYQFIILETKNSILSNFKNKKKI